MATAQHPGRLALIDGSSLQAFSTLPEIRALNAAPADRYARMAEARADRYAPDGYDTTEAGYNEDMTDALHMLAEFIVVRQDSVSNRIDLIGLKGETQGLHKWEREDDRIDQLIPLKVREVLDFYALTSNLHGVTLTKVFASPHLTDAGVNTDRLTVAEEAEDEPYVEFDENRKLGEDLQRQ